MGAGKTWKNVPANQGERGGACPRQLHSGEVAWVGVIRSGHSFGVPNFVVSIFACSKYVRKRRAQHVFWGGRRMTALRVTSCAHNMPQPPWIGIITAEVFQVPNCTMVF